MPVNIEKIWEYAVAYSTSEDEILNRLNRETHLKTVYPNMLSGNMQGQLLKLISSMLQPDRILEIGTFTGYSAICLGRGLKEGGILHTIDINDELADMANKYFRIAGLTDRIVCHTGDARRIIPGLDEIFDLAFIDGDKEQYVEYYNLIFPKIRTGGIILADNVLWGGKVISEDTDKETAGIRAFNEYVRSDSRVDKLLLPFRDGIYILHKLSD